MVIVSLLPTRQTSGKICLAFALPRISRPWTGALLLARVDPTRCLPKRSLSSLLGEGVHLAQQVPEHDH